MAEVLGVVASIIAVVQAAEAIIKVCKGYIEGVQDYPSDLRRVLLEVSTLKDIFANLEFLNDNDGAGTSPILTRLGGPDGPIEGCLRVITQLQNALPADFRIVDTSQTGSSTSQISKSDANFNPNMHPAKRRRLSKLSMTRLAWPLVKNKAQTLLAEAAQYKATITMAFSTELV